MNANAKPSVEQWPAEYALLLEQYTERPAEDLLRQTSTLGGRLVECGVAPHEVAATHTDVVARLCEQDAHAASQTLRATRPLLVELMSVYGQAAGRRIDEVTAEHRRTEEALRRREAILEAVSFAAERFLKQAGWEESAREVLQALGCAAGVSRTYIFENHRDDDGTLRTSQRYEWVGPGVEAQLANSDTQEFCWRADGFGRWETALRSGEIIHGHVREFPAREQEVLAPQDIRSIAAVPIFVAGRWWGFIGFDQCAAERVWTSAEIEALRAAAGTLGAAIQRQHADVALHRSEARFRSLAENAPNIILFTDRDGTIRFINRTVIDATPDEVVGTSMYDYIAPEFHDLARNTVERTFRTGEPGRYETMGVGRAGTSAWYDTQVGAITLDGQVTAVTQIITDITERKRAEAALRESEETVRALLNATTDVLLLIDVNGTTLAANEAVAARLGRTVDELIGRCIFDFLPPDVAEFRRAKIEEACQSGKPVRYSDERAGRYLDTVVYPLADSAGNVDRLAVFARDVTSHMWAEEALRESEERYHHLFENLHDAAFLADAETGRILETNRQGELLTGRTRAELVGMHQSELHAPGEAEEANQRFADHIARGRTADLEVEVVRKDGAVVPVAINASTLTIGGQRLALGLFRDITELKRAEQALRASQEEYRGLFENAQIGIFRTKLDGSRFVAANQKLADILGYAREELTALPPASVWAAHGDRENMLRRLREHGVLTDYEIPVLTRTGEVRTLLTTLRLHAEGDYLEGTALDITKRKRAEEALRESERRSRAIFDQTFQFIGLMTLDGTVMETNRAALDFAGIEVAAVVGKPFWETPWWSHSPELQDRLRDAVRQAAAGQFVRFEVTHPATDGSLHCIDFSLKPVLDEAGKVSLLIPEGRDITDRKRAEDELRIFKTISDRASYGAAISDLDGTLTYVNDTFAEMHGYTAGELIGQHLSVFHTDEQIPRMSALVQRLKQDGSVAAEEVWHKRRDGSVFPTLMSASVIQDETGTPSFLSATAIDITERKRAEESLAESEQRYRALFGQAPDSIALIDAEDGTLAEFNDRACENLGYTRAEFQDLTVADLEVIESRDEIVAHTAKIIGEGADIFATQHRTKTGEIRDVIVHSRPVSIGGRGFALSIWRDVTERKRTEDKLREFKTILERASYGAAVVDLDGNLTYLNDAFANMHGYASAELIGRNLSVFHNAEQMLRVDALVQRIKAEGGFSAEEVWHRRRDGSVFPTLMSATIIADETGAPRYMSSTAIDITERKQAEEALRRSEERLHFVLGAGPAVIYTAETGGDHAATFVSKNVEAQFGYAPREFVGDPKFWVNHIHPDDAPRVFRQLPSLFDRGHHTHEYRFQHKDGTWRWMRDEMRLVRDTDGNPQEIVGYWVDITERKQAEDTLRRQALVFENMFDAVVMTDRDHRITDWNPAASRVFGYARDEVLGKSTAMLAGPSEQEDQFRLVTEALEREGHWSGQGTILRKDGRVGQCETAIVVLRDDESRVIGHVAVVRDVTDRVRAERDSQRRQAELAHVTRLATMGEMATGLAHELSQPLSAILYYARGCGRRLGAGDADLEQILGIMEKVGAQAERAAGFVDRIRAFVRKSELRLAQVDLNQAVREAAEFAAHQAHEDRVTIDFELDQVLPPVLVDMMQIEQVILNVLRNGIEAMSDTEPDRRKVTIRTSHANDLVVCAVADAGCGCSDEVAERLFEAFFTTKPKGLGMGLAISLSIIEAHGGRMWATPNPAGGATLQFTLPVSEQDATV